MAADVLITGAAGTVGSSLARELRAAGVPFAALSSRPGAAIDCAETRIGDFRDADSLRRAFAGVGTLFLLLPVVPDKRALAQNAIAAARAAGVRHIVRSSGVGADPASPYALMKLQGEIDALVEASGIAFTVLRPTGFMQNFLTYQAAQVKSGTLYLPYGDTRQPLIDARDIAAVAARVLRSPAEHAGKVYDLTGGEALSSHDVAAHLSLALGREIRYEPVPPEAAAEATRDMGMPPPLVELLDSLNRYILAGEGAEVSPDVPALLGRAPITFARFARDHAAAWR